MINFNLITLINIASLGTAFLIPTSAVFFDKESALIIINYFYIAQSLSVIPDCLCLVRLEAILSSLKSKKSMLLVSRLVGNYFIFASVIFLLSIIEMYLYDFSFSLVLFVRHVFNLSKRCLPQVHALSSHSYKVNGVSVIRNSLIVIAVYFSLDSESLLLSIYIITLFEFLLLSFLTTLLLDDVKYKLLTFDSLSVSNFNKQFYKILRRFWKKTSFVGISGGFLVVVDRVIISIFFTESHQVIYLKYKLLYQYIDGFFGIFGYQIHLNIIKTKENILFNKYITLFIMMVFVGYGGFLIFLGAESLYSYLIFFFLVVLMAIKRLLDGIFMTYILSIKKYASIVKKNLSEAILVAGSISMSYFFWSEDIDKIFFLYTLITLCVSLSFCSLFFYNRKKV